MKTVLLQPDYLTYLRQVLIVIRSGSRLKHPQTSWKMTCSVRIVDAIPASEHLALYREAGWWADGEDESRLSLIISGSFLTAAAYDSDGRCIGMGRMISDGTSDGYIQDVVVLNAFRGKGIGAALIRLLESEGLARGLSWIGLIAEPGTRSFYEKLGFAEMDDYVPMLLKR